MFINRFSDLLNTSFKPEHVLDVIDQFESKYRPIMPEHIARWGRPATMSVWNDDLNVIKSFGELRGGYVRGHLQEFFNLNDVNQLTVDVSHSARGNVQVNSILIDEKLDGLDNPTDPYPWSGEYFGEYEIMLVAHPEPGFVFSSWSGDVSNTSDTLYVSVTSNKNVVANFEVLSDVSIEREGENPSGFTLSQNYPNPFNPSTGIRFSLASPDRVTLEIYDMTGSLKVVILDDKQYGSGEHTILFNAELLASGIYIYKMTTSTGYIQTKKMVLIK